MKKFILSFMFLSLLAAEAKADRFADLLNIKCYPELGILSISQEYFPGYIAEKYAEEHNQDMEKKYGLYNIRALAKLDRNRNLISAHPYKKTCSLNGENYEIEINPDGPTLGGTDWGCLRSSFNATIKYNGRVLVDHLLFYECNSSPIEDRYINEIKLNADRDNTLSYLAVTGKGVRSSKAFFFNNDTFKPLNNLNVYDAEYTYEKKFEE